MTVTTIRVPYRAETIDGMFAVALFAAKGGVTAVIDTVRVTATHFTATDRYTVGRFEFDRGGAESDDMMPILPEGAHVLVPRVAAEWLAKQTPKMLGLTPGQYPDVYIEFREDAITILWRDAEDSESVLAVTRFERVRGNFPPVEKLLPGADGPTPWLGDGNPVLALSPWLVERFVKAAKKLVVKGGTFTWTLQGTDNPNKPGPVFVEIGERFTGLVQPNLLLK